MFRTAYHFYLFFFLFSFAEALITAAGKNDGTFLLRTKSDGSWAAEVVYNNGAISHHLIQQLPDGSMLLNKKPTPVPSRSLMDVLMAITQGVIPNWPESGRLARFVSRSTLASMPWPPVKQAGAARQPRTPQPQPQPQPEQQQQAQQQARRRPEPLQPPQQPSQQQQQQPQPRSQALSPVPSPSPATSPPLSPTSPNLTDRFVRWKCGECGKQNQEEQPQSDTPRVCKHCGKQRAARRITAEQARQIHQVTMPTPHSTRGDPRVLEAKLKLDHLINAWPEKRRQLVYGTLADMAAKKSSLADFSTRLSFLFRRVPPKERAELEDAIGKRILSLFALFKAPSSHTHTTRCLANMLPRNLGPEFLILAARAKREEHIVSFPAQNHQKEKIMTKGKKKNVKLNHTFSRTLFFFFFFCGRGGCRKR